MKSPKQITQLLEDRKALDITVLDVRPLTDITDYMLICSGTSTRHTAAIADHVIDYAKAHKLPLLGVEGAEHGEWILLDLAEVIVHIFLPATRAFYNLEKLWRRKPTAK